MDVGYDFSDIKEAMKKCFREVESKEEELGTMAVDYARQNGEYHDVTGNLRASNGYNVVDDGIELFNNADYADDVESRGKDVLTGASIYLEKICKEEFGI